MQHQRKRDHDKVAPDTPTKVPSHPPSKKPKGKRLNIDEDGVGDRAGPSTEKPQEDKIRPLRGEGSGAPPRIKSSKKNKSKPDQLTVQNVQEQGFKPHVYNTEEMHKVESK